MNTQDSGIGNAQQPFAPPFGSALSRYGRHDKTCPLNGEPNLPGDERCTCGFSTALATPDPLLKRGLEAADGALVLANCYFERDGRDGCNNDNYCRLLDWMKDARAALDVTPNPD